jgi:hypothetical protein
VADRDHNQAVLTHPKNPRVRRVWIAVEIVLLIVAAALLGWQAFGEG